MLYLYIYRKKALRNQHQADNCGDLWKGMNRVGGWTVTLFFLHALECLFLFFGNMCSCIYSFCKGKGGIKIGEEDSVFIAKKKAPLILCTKAKEESKREKGHQWSQHLATALSLPCAELGTSSQNRKNPKRCSFALRLYFKFLNVDMIPQTSQAVYF